MKSFFLQIAEGCFLGVLVLWVSKMWFPGITESRLSIWIAVIVGLLAFLLAVVWKRRAPMEWQPLENSGESPER
ncbi:MAG: hypothetical protein HYZ08_02645 [Candidatus Kerfeldbacteria bacterium]|nr:hypothetical protein [Candidatus Kerfeldbacteria bacterium]